MAFVRKDALERACVALGVSLDQVVTHRLDDDSITLVVDKGIKGSPKFTIAFDDLLELKPAPKPRRRTKATSK